MVRVAPCHVGYLMGTPAVCRGGHQDRLAVGGLEDSAHPIRASWHLTLLSPEPWKQASAVHKPPRLWDFGYSSRAD